GVVLLAAGCAPPPDQPPAGVDAAARATGGSGSALEILFADEWAARLARDPLFASSMGITDHDRLLPDASPARHERSLAEDREFLSRLAAIDRASLSAEEQLNYDLFRFIVGSRAKLAEYRPYLIPILSDDGFHMRVQRMYEAMPFDSVADYE